MATGFEEIDNVINQSKTLLEQSAEQQNKIVDLGIQKATNTANKQKQELEEEATKQGKQLYTDYKKQSSEFGVNAENLASKGLNNSGYTETSNVDMFNTYQKNVTNLAMQTTKLKAEVDFNLNQAMIDADVQKAENEANKYLQQMQLLMTEYDMRFAREQFEWQKQYQTNRDAISDQQWQKQYELSLSNSKKAKGSTSGYGDLILEAEPDEKEYDMGILSERANQILDRLEVAEVNNYESAKNVIDKTDLPSEEKEIMKRYIKEYINAK